MPDHIESYAIAPAAQDAPILRLTSVLTRAMTPDPVALAASFGRWWLEPLSSQIVLSLEAAALLGERPGLHRNLAGCLAFVLPEDMVLLTTTLSRALARAHPIDCEFRVASPHEGLRWVRLVVLPPADPRRPGPVIEGILTDITAARHAAMREQFSFESTQLLIGTHSLGEAVSKVIELVCTDLGWDCGMYWSVQPGEHGGKLHCVHYWSGPAIPAIDALINPGGRRGSIAPGQGLIGGVWSSGQPRWTEDVSADGEFLVPELARQSGLRSGYAFPVAYGAEGGLQRPGVLAFFSCLARQRTAQLPNLSAAIGGLIAQTAQRIAQQESIRHLAQVDVLSGLANRRHFHELLDAACERAAERGGTLAVLYIDLDRFKPINDALGHEVGDAVLRQFSQRLAGLTPPDGLAGRVGGDEFALFLWAGASPERLGELAELILQAARTRFVIDGRELAISASVGISLFPDNGAQGAELLRHADSAMYRVKRAGRNGASFYSHGGEHAPGASQSVLVQQLTMEAELIDALADGQLFMHYQPVFGTHDRQVRAVEALIRWRRPGGEMVPPDVFIPIAEKSHLIIDIGRWVVQQACRDLALLHRSGLPGVQMNVNMAALEFLNVNLPDELSAIAAAAGISPRHLCLELTEGMMMNHADQVVPVMRDLRRRGFKISIDDFGMAYSSLSRLKDLPISSLKIDRSFIHGLPDAVEDCAIVQTILDIGRNMRLEVVAEGVENTAQFDHLSKLGCALIQGYLMGRPMLPADLIKTHGVPSPTL